MLFLTGAVTVFSPAESRERRDSRHLQHPRAAHLHRRRAQPGAHPVLDAPARVRKDKLCRVHPRHQDVDRQHRLRPHQRRLRQAGPARQCFPLQHPKGLGFLKALLKYQIVANTTLYSNAIYEDAADADVAPPHRPHHKRTHVELTTLLNDTKLAVDIAGWGSWLSFKVNGYVPVVVRDGIALNGVVQVVGRVPFPLHKPGGETTPPPQAEYFDGEIEVEDLVRRLAPYVSREDVDQEQAGDL